MLWTLSCFYPIVKNNSYCILFFLPVFINTFSPVLPIVDEKNMEGPKRKDILQKLAHILRIKTVNSEVESDNEWRKESYILSIE